MRPSVAEIFPAFSERFEGRTPHLYLDIHGVAGAVAYWPSCQPCLSG